MPQLRNIRRERFAQNFISGKAQGLSNGRIYMLSGYTAKSVEAADVNACRLLQQPDVAARIVELAAPAKTIVRDAEHFMGKFEQVFQGSIKAEQFGNANRSAELQARIGGVLTDKLEVSVEFGGARNAKEVVAEMLREFGSVAEMRACLNDIIAQAEEIAAEQAKAINGHAVVAGADTVLTQLDKAEKVE
ncbi:hypothetical protein [Bradyrhizobium sp. SZCCHNR1098]|uniref:hypothetical protein n=1 Tax=Bradyrhizobium sp. SZCCHNR1098 TaxID=3057370 RepID=UPI0029170FFF|nr:hypothetical protein [Bradyrhizobium sp. SZCCHNR1098]